MTAATHDTDRVPGIARVAVFCGSRIGARAIHAEAIAELGAGLAARGIGLIYGGGRIGLMGRLADATLDADGDVVGIIPEFLGAREVAHARVTELITTDSMHSRKQLMFARADAFLAMPGGLGTLDETIEILTWRQLGLHDKPVIIVDVGGWARGLIAALEASIADGFADLSTRALFDVVPDVASALALLETTVPNRDTAPVSRL
jgi:uncharacterized protein (TIGR00730 family)